MIHPCQKPSRILPTDISDQLRHAVIKNRTTKPVKSSIYSAKSKIHEQRGTFNGINTCSFTTIVKFDFTPKLTNKAESITNKNYPNINAILAQLVQIIFI